MALARLLSLVLALKGSSVAKSSKVTLNAWPGLRVTSEVETVFCDGLEVIVGSGGTGGGAFGFVGVGTFS